jgi:hypothetical protein
LALAKAARCKETNDAERSLVGSYRFALLRNWELNLYASRKRLDDPGMFESYKMGLRSAFTQPEAREWWGRNKLRSFSTNFVEAIEQIINDDLATSDSD